MAVSGATARVYTTGTSTPVTGEPCTLSGGDTIATVANPAKCIADPDATVTLYDNGVAQATNTYTFNHLFCVASKVLGTWTGPVTLDFSYLPRLELDETASADLTLSRDPIDATVMSANVSRTRIMGLMSASLSLMILAAPNKDYDSGGGVTKLESVLNAATLKVLEVVWPGSSAVFRMFARAASNSNPTSVEGRREGTFEFVSTGNSNTLKSFAWSDE